MENLEKLFEEILNEVFESPELLKPPLKNPCSNCGKRPVYFHNLCRVCMPIGYPKYGNPEDDEEF